MHIMAFLNYTLIIHQACHWEGGEKKILSVCDVKKKIILNFEFKRKGFFVDIIIFYQ